MHLLATIAGTIPDGSAAVDLGQTPGDIVVLSSADTELALLAAAQARLRAQDPAVLGLRLASILQLGHNYSVDLYMETVAAAPIGPTGSRVWRRLVVRMVFRWRCCPATTSLTQSYPDSRPFRPRQSTACGVISSRAARQMPRICCAMQDR